ncbi:RDD family protein [Variovorax sp. Root411]|uniref:RDD family protein n=1 Tax=Variovorax sp. Root411 TaxID=1736530 RepID=UPI0006FDE9C3|nr:RDD family protein [Variovorax sp. Root411]KQW60314.1 hypothetical protein ASC92_27755 [Variovorax sp. Root411]
MDAAYLRQHYDRLETDELIRLRSTELTPEAKVVLEAELASRDVQHSFSTVAASASALLPLDQSSLAPLWRRFAAAALDYVGLFVVLFGVNFPTYLYTPKNFSDLVGYASIAVALAYLFFKDGLNGQSFGKRLLKIDREAASYTAEVGQQRPFAVSAQCSQEERFKEMK